MGKIKFAYNTLVYAGESIDESIARLARHGYDGVEFVGTPEVLDAGRIVKLLNEFHLEASSICGIYTPETDLVSSREEVRGHAIEYLKGLVDFASSIGARNISVTPTACMKIHAEADLTQERSWAVEGLKEAGTYAAEHAVRFAVEPWNRYENYLINRAEQSLAIVNEVGLPNVGCMLDTFHMNLEETDIAEAIRLVNDKLFYIHFADSNRAAPGRGHIDFDPIVKAIEDIGYEGYISLELLPAAADPFETLRGSRCDEFYDQYTEESIRFLRTRFE